MLVPLRDIPSGVSISDEELEMLREHFLNGGSIVDWVLDNLSVNDRDYAEALSRHTGIPLLENPEFDSEQESKLKAICRPQTALRFRVLPLSVVMSEDDEKPLKVTLANYDPLSTVDRVMVRREVDCPIDWVLSPRAKVTNGLHSLYGVGADTVDDLLAKKDFGRNEFDNKQAVSKLDGGDDAEASVEKFVHQILNEALNSRATDIHIEPLRNDLRVRYRIDGVLRKVNVPDNFKKLQSAIISRLKTMSQLDTAEERRPQDGSARLEWDDKQIDARVATIPSVEGESISLRLLGREKFEMKSLDLYPELEREIDGLLAQPNGIVLVTGPTGCGKSTSLFLFSFSPQQGRYQNCHD